MRAECERVLRVYPALADQLRFSANQPNRGFSGAGVFRVEAECGSFALRAWPRNSLPLKRLEGLHRLIEFVHWTGVTQIAVPLKNGDGKTIVEFNGRFWQLEPWMPGTSNFHQQPSSARLKSAMKTLAEWHMAAGSFQAEAQSQHWFGSSHASSSPACRERHHLLAEWLNFRLEKLSSQLTAHSVDLFCELARQIICNVKRIGPRILNELQEASNWNLPLQPCLRDVWHDHVLYTGDQVTGLIDLGACRRESVATDLARLLGSLVGDDAHQWQLAIDEYSQHRPLDQSERKLISTLDRSATVLSGLTWLRRRFLEETPGNYQWPIVLQRLETIAARLRVIANA